MSGTILQSQQNSFFLLCSSETGFFDGFSGFHSIAPFASPSVADIVYVFCISSLKKIREPRIFPCNVINCFETFIIRQHSVANEIRFGLFLCCV